MNISDASLLIYASCFAPTCFFQFRTIIYYVTKIDLSVLFNDGKIYDELKKKRIIKICSIVNWKLLIEIQK